MPSSMASDLTATGMSADPMLQQEFSGAGGVYALPSMTQQQQSLFSSNPETRPKFSIPGLGEFTSEPSPFAPQSQPQPGSGMSSAPSNAADPQFSGTFVRQDNSIQELASLMSSSTGQSEAELQEILSQLQKFDPIPDFGVQEMPTYNPGEFWGSNYPEGQPFQAEGEMNSATLAGDEWRKYMDEHGISPTVIPDWNGGVRFS